MTTRDSLRWLMRPTFDFEVVTCDACGEDAPGVSVARPHSDGNPESVADQIVMLCAGCIARASYAVPCSLAIRVEEELHDPGEFVVDVSGTNAQARTCSIAIGGVRGVVLAAVRDWLPEVKQ